MKRFAILIVSLLLIAIGATLTHGQGCQEGVCGYRPPRQATQPTPPTTTTAPRHTITDLSGWEAVVFVQTRDRDGASSHGTGVVVEPEKTRYILTAEHVVRDATSVSISLYDGRSYKATILVADATWDVAVLSVPDLPREVRPIAIEPRRPKLGESCRLVSVSGGKLTALMAPVGGTYSPQGDTTQDWFYAQNGPSVQGDSGGPVLTSTGLIGVCWGGTESEFVFTCWDRIAAIIATIPKPQQTAAPVLTYTAPNWQPPTMPTVYETPPRTAPTPPATWRPITPPPRPAPPQPATTLAVQPEPASTTEPPKTVDRTPEILGMIGGLVKEVREVKAAYKAGGKNAAILEATDEESTGRHFDNTMVILNLLGLGGVAGGLSLFARRYVVKGLPRLVASKIASPEPSEWDKVADATNQRGAKA